MHGAGDDDVPARVEQPHERDLAAGEPGGREREQRERGSLVAGECGVSGPAQQRDLLAQPARTGRGARRREHATGDLGDAVGERDLVRAERLAAVPAAEDQPDGRPCGIAQRDRDHRLGALLALVRDLGGIGRDPRVIRLERGTREAVGDAQRPALHEARAAADRGGDHEPSVGLGQRHGAPVAAQRLGGRPRDLRERAVDVDRRRGERARGLAHLVELRGATAQDRAVGGLDLGHRGSGDSLDEPPGRADELDCGTRLDAGARLQHRSERAVQAVQRGCERQAAGDRACHAPAEGHRGGLLAARIAQAVLERVERHVDGLAHRSERHAVRGHGVMRRERGALEQHGAARDEQRDRRAGSVVEVVWFHFHPGSRIRPTDHTSCACGTLNAMADGPGRRGRWVSEPEDPALEVQLQRELEQRRQARIEARRRRRYEKREGLLFWFFALLLAGLVGLIGYGVVIVTRSVLG